jgi:hypothetical protein
MCWRRSRNCSATRRSRYSTSVRPRRRRPPRLPTACLTTSSASPTHTGTSANASSPSPRSRLRRAPHCTAATRLGWCPRRAPCHAGRVLPV